MFLDKKLIDKWRIRLSETDYYCTILPFGKGGNFSLSDLLEWSISTYISPMYLQNEKFIFNGG
jgi:hypothetical protein